MIVTSYSRFLVSGVSDTSESLGHFAESTLFSHEKVSDDFSSSSYQRDMSEAGYKNAQIPSLEKKRRKRRTTSLKLCNIKT